MTEILPCFYCGEPCRTNRLTGEGLYVECTGENCYSGPILGKNIEKQCIKQHNFIAKAVLEAEKKENQIYWLGDEPRWYDDPNLDEDKEGLMESIFDMKFQDVMKLAQNKNIIKRRVDLTSVNPKTYLALKTGTHERFSISNFIDLDSLNSLKKLIDHQIAYLKQKEEKESKKFRTGWTYKGKDGLDYLILDTDNLQTCYCWNDKSLYLTMHLCLDVFSGRNWEPK